MLRMLIIFSLHRLWILRIHMNWKIMFIHLVLFAWNFTQVCNILSILVFFISFINVHLFCFILNFLLIYLKIYIRIIVNCIMFLFGWYMQQEAAVPGPWFLLLCLRCDWELNFDAWNEMVIVVISSSIVMQEETKNSNQKEVEEQLRSLKEELTKIKYSCSNSYIQFSVTFQYFSLNTNGETSFILLSLIFLS